jgi:hypothetical protein
MNYIEVAQMMKQASAKTPLSYSEFSAMCKEAGVMGDLWSAYKGIRDNYDKVSDKAAEYGVNLKPWSIGNTFTAAKNGLKGIGKGLGYITDTNVKGTKAAVNALGGLRSGYNTVKDTAQNYGVNLEPWNPKAVIDTAKKTRNTLSNMGNSIQGAYNSAKSGLNSAGNAIGNARRAIANSGIGQAARNFYNNQVTELGNNLYDNYAAGKKMWNGDVTGGLQDFGNIAGRNIARSTNMLGNGLYKAYQGARAVGNGLQNVYNRTTNALGNGIYDAYRGAQAIGNGMQQGYNEALNQ